MVFSMSGLVEECFSTFLAIAPRTHSLGNKCQLCTHGTQCKKKHLANFVDVLLHWEILLFCPHTRRTPDAQPKMNLLKMIASQ